jgi:predicted amidophosphoribosyltransferase
MKCPSCGAAVEEGADLCLECGEPMGDSPVARIIRGEDANTSPLPKLDPFPVAVVQTRPAKTEAVRLASIVQKRPPSAKPKMRRVDDDPEPVRCPGCGMPSTRQRCPNCGTVLRHDD